MLRIPAIFILLAAAFLLLPVLPLSGAGVRPPEEEGFTQVLPAENVEMLSLDREVFWRLSLMVRAAFRESDQLMGTKGVPKRRLSVMVMAREFGENEYRGSDIPVHIEDDVHETVWRLCRGMLERRAAEIAGGSRKSRARSIDVLAAALTNRIVYDGKGGNGAYRQDYRIPDAQFKDGSFPDLETLLAQPVPPVHPLLFRIYLVHCDLLVQCLEDTSGNFPAFLERWFTIQDNEKLSPFQALQATLPPGIFRTGETLQAWYERSAMERASKGLFRNTPEEIAARLKELTSIPVLDASSSGGVRMIPLRKVPKLLKDYREDGSALTELQRKLLHLKIVSPVLMRDALDAYVSAVDALRNGNKKEFNRQLDRGEKLMATSMKQMKVVEAMLDEAESGDERKNYFRNSAWREIMDKAEVWRAPLEAVAVP